MLANARILTKIVSVIAFIAVITACGVAFTGVRMSQIDDGYTRFIERDARAWVNGHFVGAHSGGYTPFVLDITHDPDDLAIARGTIALAHSLGLRVIAEGVETEAQRDLLRASSCDEIQGYFVARPMPADETADFLARKPATPD